MRLYFLIACIFLSVIANGQKKYYFTQGWLFNAGDSISWAECNYADMHWTKVNAGIPWQEFGYENIRQAWYRYHLNIPKNLRATIRETGFIKINFGMASEAAQYFFNGRGLGQSGSLPPRFYKADKSKSVEFYVSEPEIRWDTLNIISIRVYSTDSLQGGLVKGPVYYFIPTHLE